MEHLLSWSKSWFCYWSWFGSCYWSWYWSWSWPQYWSRYWSWARSRFQAPPPQLKRVLCLLQVLFLGPLMQQALDCPWGLLDGIRVLLGEPVGGGCGDEERC